jgi:general stress protein 26
MPTAAELKSKFWSSLKSDMTVMLGLAGVDDAHLRPMTAQVEGDKGPIWFFASKDAELVKKAARNHKAIMSFVSKNHGLWATVHGTLVVDNDPEMIDRLWNRYVAAWYEKGKDDPKLALLRLDPKEGEIWLDGSSLIAGIKMLLGSDPKEDYKENVKKVKLG